jgi:hypothetical protein
MNETTQLLALVALAAIGIVAVLFILRRERRSSAPPAESPFAASTEGEKRCPRCGMGNLWTDRNCIACGAGLPG